MQWDQTAVFWTHSVTPIVVGTPIAVLAVGLLNKNEDGKKRGMYLASTMLISTVFSAGLKYSIQRKRPFIAYPDLDQVVAADTPSFPSGHTTKAFALATSLSLAYPKWYVIAPSFLWAAGVGYTRMHLGVHYPSDVLGGMILGSGTAFLSVKLNQWLNKRIEKDWFFDGKKSVDDAYQPNN